MARVGAQVHEHLVNLDGIGDHRPGVLVDPAFYFNGGGEGRLQELEHLLDD